MALQPPVGQRLLTVEALRSHSDTTHPWWDSSEGVIGTSPKPLTDNTQDSQSRHQFPRRDSNPHFQQASGRRPAP